MAELPGTVEDHSAIYAKRARSCAIGLYALTAIWGALQIAFPGKEALYLVFALLFATFATSWAILDARARGIRFLHILQMLYFFLWPVGAVIYLLYRSGFRGLLTAVIHAVGLLATHAAAIYSTLYGLHYAGMLDARFY